MQFFGCIYRYRLTGVPDGHFLRNTPYFGQTIRWVASHQEAFDKRHGEHVRAVTKKSAEGGMQALGLHEAMREFGEDAFKRTIVATFPPFQDRALEATAWQQWADCEEMRLIDENGGVMRYFEDEEDDHGGCQTFNLTPGGQANAGGAQKRWEALWARSQQAWLTFQSELQKYAEANDGDMKVLQDYITASGYHLGTAVEHVRSRDQYLKGHPERREWLDSQSGWTWGVHDSSWDEFQSELLNYADAHDGDMKVPQRYNTTSGYKLGSRVSEVRGQDQYLKGHPERREWLERQTGWAWSVPESSWDEFQSELLKYAQARNGDMTVQHDYKTANGYPLGRTVNSVRSRYQYLNGHPERIRWLLDHPGWKWLVHRSRGETDATRRAHWEKVWREQAPPRAEVAEEPEYGGGGARHLGKRKRQQPQ